MSDIQNLLEYFDELYPVTAAQKRFYDNLTKKYPSPAKFLRIACGTGMFESFLAREGYDVTGIDNITELLRVANMRRRNQLMSIRFFQMDYADITGFLGHGFYNIISCLNNRIIDIQEQKQFLSDVKKLLTDGGTFVVSMLNYDTFVPEPMVKLPTKESLRVKLYTELWSQEEGEAFITQNLETGTGKMIPIQRNKRIYPITPKAFKAAAKSAGFKNIQFYSGFDREPFTGYEETVVAICS